VESLSRRQDPDDLPVTERVCLARMSALEERIEGLKKTIYISSMCIITVLSVVQIVLQLVR